MRTVEIPGPWEFRKLLFRLELIHFILTVQPNRAQWQKVLFISAGISTVGGIIFLLFASGEEQKWNKQSTTDARSESETKHLLDRADSDNTI